MRRRGCSHRFLADLFRPDANGVFDWQNKNLAITDLARFGGAHHYGDSFLDHVVREHDFDFHLWQKINGVFTAAINFSMPFLAAESLYFRDRHSFDAELGQRLFYFLEFERLDDRFEFFHCG